MTYAFTTPDFPNSPRDRPLETGPSKYLTENHKAGAIIEQANEVEVLSHAGNPR